MKLSLMQENLARGLSLVSRAVSSRATLPVLSNVLLKTQDGGLRLTATNLEIGISAWVPGKIETDGAMTVPARLLTDVVSGLPAGERVDLQMEKDKTLLMRAGTYRTHLRGHRGGGVPGHPQRWRATHHPGQPDAPFAAPWERSPSRRRPTRRAPS